jgi:hypothetical protein
MRLAGKEQGGKEEEREEKKTTYGPTFVHAFHLMADKTSALSARSLGVISGGRDSPTHNGNHRIIIGPLLALRSLGGDQMTERAAVHIQRLHRVRRRYYISDRAVDAIGPR